MNFLRNLALQMTALADGDAGLGDSLNMATSSLTGTARGTIKSIMKVAMPIVLSVVLAMGVFYSLKLGIEYAKTETTEKREEAKKRLVGAIIGFGIGIVAAAVLWILFTNDSILTAIFN